MPHDDSSEQTAAREVIDQGVAHLAVLARAPRAAGSAAEDDAREYCARALRASGFDVALESFAYSTLPGRYGTPIGGAIAWLSVAATALLGASGKSAHIVALVFALGPRSPSPTLIVFHAAASDAPRW